MQMTSDGNIPDQSWAAHQTCEKLCLVVCDTCLLCDLEVFLLDRSDDGHLHINSHQRVSLAAHYVKIDMKPLNGRVSCGM